MIVLHFDDHEGLVMCATLMYITIKSFPIEMACHCIYQWCRNRGNWGNFGCDTFWYIIFCLKSQKKVIA